MRQIGDRVSDYDGMIAFLIKRVKTSAIERFRRSDLFDRLLSNGCCFLGVNLLIQSLNSILQFVLTFIFYHI